MRPRTVAKAVPGSSAAIEVRCQAPFAVGVALWRDETSRVLATIVAKATYHLTQGTSELADQPDPIRHSDEYGDGGAAGSLRFASDLALFKAAHEVLVVGHVHASGNRPAHTATARVVVGPIEKLAEATTARRFDRAGQLHVDPPQTRFPLRYELAAFGVDNPSGIDPTDYTPAGGHVLPQLRPPSFEVRPGDHVPLVGMGPLNGSWPQRAKLLRAQDRDWLLDPLRRPRPKGFDARYFCTAPADQRSDEALRADERLILEGLHPEHARLVTTLAGITPVLRAVPPKRPLPPFVADTLTIDTDRRIATLVFRAIVPLGDDRLVVDLVSEGQGELTVSLGGDSTTELDTSALGDPPRSAGGDSTTELDTSAFGDAATTALPFAPTSEPGRARLPSTADGTLPFRPSLPQPPSSPRPVSVPPASTPRPPLVSTPGERPLVDQVVPPPAHSGLGVQRSLSETDERSPEPPAGRALDPVARVDAKDPFRKAFGNGGAAELRATTAPTPPPARVGAPSPPDLTPASSVAKPAVDAAAPAGAKAASDAAVAEAARMAARLGSALGKPQERAPTIARRAIIDLLAFDPGVPDRLRRSKVHAPLLTAAASARTPRKVDVPTAEQTPDERARVEVLRVLSCGAPLGPDELHAAFDQLIDDPQDFEIPLLLVEGEVKPTMDELETLRVAVELVKPLAGNSKRVQAALGLASDALSRSVPPLSESAASLYRQLEASTTELPLPPRHLAEQVDRTLLEARSFKKRTLLGAPRIRAELILGKLVLPIYLPESVASRLPLLPGYPISALVEFRPREDVAEPSPAALVAFALGRVLRARR